MANDNSDDDYEQKSLLSKRFFMDRAFLARFARILRILFSTSSTRLLFLMVLIACGINEVAVYFTGILPSEFYSVLVGKKADDFKTLTFQMLGVLLATALVIVLIHPKHSRRTRSWSLAAAYSKSASDQP
jgi:hypothetical protein